MHPTWVQQMKTGYQQQQKQQNAGKLMETKQHITEKNGQCIN